MSRRRLVPIIVILALSTPLAGCGGGSNFDPTDIFNFLDNKKPLPGERKPVFPEGVPGVDRGVPPDMVKGSPGATAARQQIEQAQQPQQPQQQPGATQTAVAPAEEEAPPAAAPPPRTARPKASGKRRSVTAPPPEEAPAPTTQQAQPAPAPSPFPSPVPSGTFTR